MNSRILYRLTVAAALTLLASCGDPTDRPEDCTANQYFDDARKLCVTCPAVIQPTCADGCGFEIVADSRGCSAAECVVGSSCDRCDAISFVDPETLTCEPCVGPTTCDEGEPTRRISDGSCTLVCP